jgi:hypothetical protein
LAEGSIIWNVEGNKGILHIRAGKLELLKVTNLMMLGLLLQSLL